MSFHSSQGFLFLFGKIDFGMNLAIRPKKMNMKKTTTFLLSLILLTCVQAQNNIVPNPSFEETSGRIKDGGSIELAEPWKSATMIPVDLYSAGAKSDEFSVPENAYGEEEPKTGSNYVGISFFGYGSRIPRSYLSVELTQSLEEGKEYCMKFHVSMSDMSKFAVNNLGMHVSKEEISDQTDGILKLTPHIKSLKNDPFSKQFLWTAICGVYKAEGGEKFITIGNFDTDENTTQEKVRLSREFSGKRQQNNGYYFVDDVSVIELNEKTRDDCLCDKIAGGKMEVEFKSFGTDKSKRDEAKKTYIVNSDGTRATEESVKKETPVAEKGFAIETAVVMFDDKSPKLSPEALTVLKEVVNYMKENEAQKLTIVGHIDESETGVQLLAKQRAFYVRKKLKEMGINDTRLTHTSKEATMPSAENTPASNRRVTFSVN